MRVLLLVLISLSLYAGSYEKIVETKVLKIAMRKIPINYLVENEKIVVGFNYELAQEFAKYLHVKLSIVNVKSFRSYWTKDDKVIFKMKAPVTPDVFNSADMSLDITYKNKKREKYIDMVSYMGNKNIVFTNNNMNIKNINDLVGKTFLTGWSVQSFTSIKDLLEKNKIDYKVHLCVYDKKSNYLIYDEPLKLEKEKVNLLILKKGNIFPNLFNYLVVNDGRIDTTPASSFTHFQKLIKYGFLRDKIITAFPLDKDMKYLAATFAKNSPKLRDKFAEFIKKSEKNGLLNSLMLKHLGVSLENYNKLLEYH